MNNNRWTLQKGKIIWNCTADRHTDTIEMSGNRVSAIITYGVGENGHISISRELRYPQLRTLPKNTHSTLGCFHNQIQIFTVNGKAATEYPESFVFDGIMHAHSKNDEKTVCFERSFFPCCKTRAYIEHVVVTNCSQVPVNISSEGINEQYYERGSKGIYTINVLCDKLDNVTLMPGDSVVSDLIFSARLPFEKPYELNGERELAERMSFVHKIFSDSPVLKTDDDSLDCMFNFSKLRAAESIFDTNAGPLHSPGGGAYYAAVWTNDQVEYAAPLFPFIGYDRANSATLNAFDLFIPFMGENLQPIPSSIIDEGHDLWEGAGDRGDAAMFLYGVTRFLLAYGDRETARKYLYSIDWCVRYILSRKNKDGVIASDSDELEGRFESGNANLCTSCLAYAGLISAADILNELGINKKADEYVAHADALRKNIEKFFGAEISGYNTYRYYKENTLLRSWICIPLTMGITERKEETVKALLSDRLFGKDGLVCEEGNTIFWDRSTLYALRGILNAGYSDRVYDFLLYYVNKRLLGDHVPYAVEAYPEGNQRHLSAESALFARVITEGIFGIVPRGFSSFDICPSIPKKLEHACLENIRAFGNCFSLKVKRAENGYDITLKTADGQLRELFTPFGEALRIKL